jgi:hypothetical protein
MGDRASLPRELPDTPRAPELFDCCGATASPPEAIVSFARSRSSSYAESVAARGVPRSGGRSSVAIAGRPMACNVPLLRQQSLLALIVLASRA